MKPANLIPDEWLVAYAAGTVSEAKSAFIATHASFHPELKSKISAAEALGGALVEDAEAADIPTTLLDRVLNQIDSTQEMPAPLAVMKAESNDNIPEPLAKYLGINLDQLKWRFMGPGMKQVKLWNGPDGERLWLLKARGGTEIPEHGHTGEEMTLVLQGSYHVNGQKFGVGDVEIANDAIEDHQPMIDEGEDCICLVVTHAPIKLKSMVSRMFQPFIGL
jgi:putative transcriptional regulator